MVYFMETCILPFISGLKSHLRGFSAGDVSLWLQNVPQCSSLSVFEYFVINVDILLKRIEMSCAAPCCKLV